MAFVAPGLPHEPGGTRVFGPGGVPVTTLWSPPVPTAEVTGPFPANWLVLFLENVIF